jgi:hypothetical protein
MAFIPDYRSAKFWYLFACPYFYNGRQFPTARTCGIPGSVGETDNFVEG